MPSINDLGVNKKIVNEVIEPFPLFSNLASFFNNYSSFSLKEIF